MKQSLNYNSAEPLNEMDLQLMRISTYHSIIISKNIGSIMLIIYIVSAILLNGDSIPAFYILAANNFLPFLFTPIFQHNKKSNNNSNHVLPLFSKRYDYTYLKYQCSSLSFIFVFLLLALWQRREWNRITSFHLFSLTPAVILIVMFLLRSLGTIYYRRKFQQMLLDSSF